jgi:hypothetical protein
MIATAEKVLNKRVMLNPYDNMFDKPQEEGDSRGLDKINHFLQLVLPLYNENKEINIAELAEEVGIDVEQAESIWEQVKKGFDRNLKK